MSYEYKSPAADLESERRRGRKAGGIGLAAVALSFAGLLLASRGSGEGAASGPGRDRGQQLVDFEEAVGLQAAAAASRALSLLLMIAVGWALYRATMGRGVDVPRFVRRAGVAGPVMVAVATVVGFLALRGVAVDYVAGPAGAARAQELIDEDGLLRGSFWFERVAFLVMGTWLIGISLQAMRCGLLTRVLGVWGIGTGVAVMALPIGAALLLGWVASVSLLLVGYWPGGRPEAWDGVRPVPWDQSASVRGGGRSARV